VKLIDEGQSVKSGVKLQGWSKTKTKADLLRKIRGLV
jgi:hypothetical protein